MTIPNRLQLIEQALKWELSYHHLVDSNFTKNALIEGTLTLDVLQNQYPKIQRLKATKEEIRGFLMKNQNIQIDEHEAIRIPDLRSTLQNFNPQHHTIQIFGIQEQNFKDEDRDSLILKVLGFDHVNISKNKLLNSLQNVIFAKYDDYSYVKQILDKFEVHKLNQQKLDTCYKIKQDGEIDSGLIQKLKDNVQVMKLHNLQQLINRYDPNTQKQVQQIQQAFWDQSQSNLIQNALQSCEQITFELLKQQFDFMKDLSDGKISELLNKCKILEYKDQIVTFKCRFFLKVIGLTDDQIDISKIIENKTKIKPNYTVFEYTFDNQQNKQIHLLQHTRLFFKDEADQKTVYEQYGSALTTPTDKVKILNEQNLVNIEQFDENVIQNNLIVLKYKPFQCQDNIQQTIITENVSQQAQQSVMNNAQRNNSNYNSNYSTSNLQSDQTHVTNPTLDCSIIQTQVTCINEFSNDDNSVDQNFFEDEEFKKQKK
uniref:Uncharacterized protein n=1 Tax=Trepomonas sp. PC1 TaxID=1076344 RepID=A0A146K1P9_9EUKA|eukprot:JAP89845.1 Hypothetical protein TPC1_30660 [Trepomonas sp. PC1]